MKDEDDVDGNGNGTGGNDMGASKGSSNDSSDVVHIGELGVSGKQHTLLIPYRCALHSISTYPFNTPFLNTPFHPFNAHTIYILFLVVIIIHPLNSSYTNTH